MHWPDGLPGLKSMIFLPHHLLPTTVALGQGDTAALPDGVNLILHRWNTR